MTAGPFGCFVTGTDTEIGKTHVAVALVRALVAEGLRVAVMKPVAAGALDTPDGLRNDDALALIAASNVPAPYERVNPYCFAPPVSPHIAAAEAGVAIEPRHVVAAARSLAAGADALIVEGAGGWLAPISAERSIADIATALRLPVLMVVGLRLGCLSHALLTAESIRARGLLLAGWVGNCIDPSFVRAGENLATLAGRLGSEPFAVLPRVGAGEAGSFPADGAARLAARLRLVPSAPGLPP